MSVVAAPAAAAECAGHELVDPHDLAFPAPTARAAAPALRRARPTNRPVADGKPGALPWEDGQGPRWEEVDALIAAILGEQLGPLPGLD
jgi:hypothetical protein